MAKGYGPGQMNWGGLKPGTYQVSACDTKDHWEEVAEVGEDGSWR